MSNNSDTTTSVKPSPRPTAGVADQADAWKSSLPLLYTSGTYYQVGLDIGAFYADRIKRFFQESKQIQICVLYVATEKGKKFFQECLTVCGQNFPQYINELRGLADGSGMRFEDIFLMNISKEIGKTLVKEEDDATGCTDIMVNTPDTKLLAHNEDCDPLNGPYGFMINARILDKGQEVEHFTAFCYPGMLPGCTFSFNKYGMVFGINGLGPNYVVHNAAPRMFLNRAVLRAQNVDEAITILKNKGFGSAYGFNTNIVDIKCPSKMWAIELGPQSDESLLHVHTIEEENDPLKQCHYIHYNKFERLDVTSHLQPSSVAREKRANQLKKPRNRRDILNILGDTADELYPIYRSPRPTDVSQTVFTAVVDVLQGQVDMYRGNPSEESAMPLFSLPITCHCTMEEVVN